MENKIHIMGVENIVSLKMKDGLNTKRRVLRDISQNEPLPRTQNGLKNQDSVDKEKKCIVAVKPVTRSYKHVQAKVNSGLPTKVVKPQNEVVLRPLKREESTAVLANRARNVASLNALQNKISNINLKKGDSKENISKIKDPLKCLTNIKIETDVSCKGSEVAKIKEAKIINNSKDKKKEPSVTAKKTSYSTELLDGVHDIDEGQEKSLTLMSIYVKDIYLYLREIETKYPVKPQYLDKHVNMTAKMRSMLIDWLVQVHGQFDLYLETLHLTVGIIDRYLQTKPDIVRMQIQLVGITALYIASKYEEMFPPDIRDYTYITDNTYTKRDILKCEKAILKTLEFQLGRPLPIHFVRRLIKAADVTQQEHTLAKYLVDLSLVDYQFVHYKPSEVAAAAVCLSIALLAETTPRECWTPNLVFYSGYSFSCISPIIKKLAQILSTVQSSRFTAVTDKYNTSKYGKISSFPELVNASKYCK